MHLPLELVSYTKVRPRPMNLGVDLRWRSCGRERNIGSCVKKRERMMRELTEVEVERVSGGVLPALLWGGGIAAGVSGITTWGAGGNSAQVAVASALGGISGATGGLVTTVYGATRLVAAGVTAAMGLAANFAPKAGSLANLSGPGSPAEREGGS